MYSHLRHTTLAVIPFEEGQPLAHFFELYHRHRPLAGSTPTL